MAAGVYRSFHLPESTTHYTPEKDFHTQHAKIELSLDFSRKRIAGSCTLKIVPIGPGLGRVVLDACGMEIYEVSLDGSKCEFGYDQEKLTINPPAPLSGSHTVKVAYSSTPSEGIYFIEPDGEHPEKEVQAWTHSEAEFARYWFPCYDKPNDKFTSEVLLTVPKGFRVISNGKLVSEQVNGDVTTFHWKEELPHPSYLTSFVAGKLGEMKQEAEGVYLQYYFPESKRADVLRYFGETPRMIKVFNEVTGVRYPYSKYAQTTVENFIFGGMENFNATTLTMLYYPDASSEEDFQASYSTPNRNPTNLVAHELAHQWFGDLVTCVDWSHAWLNEGFADYMQAVYIERTRGVDQFRLDLGFKAVDFFDEDADEFRRPTVEKDFVYPDDLFDMAIYAKGAWMLHELRYVLGDGAFFEGISSYLKAHSFSNADTHDFRKSMERVSGRSLEGFFEQAFYKTGFPEFEVEYAWDEASKTASLRIRQTQKLEMQTPVFKLPCDIVMYVDGARKKRRVILDSGDQTFSFSLASEPTIVEFDPEHWLLKKVRFRKNVELLVSQLEGSADASSRAEAARNIGEIKAGSAVGALVRAAEKVQFWDVNASALRALGEIGTTEALSALLRVGVPAERRTRRALAEALGNFKDESARSLLITLLQTDQSPYVRCEAALSLAKAWPEGAFQHLTEAMKVHTPNETLAEACLDAMGKLKDAGVAAVISENIVYGKPLRARIGALKAIKGRGRLLEDEFPMIKEMLLKDKEFRVREYVVSKLIPSLGDTRFLDTLKEASRTDRDPRVKRKALEVFHSLSEAAEASATVARLRDEVQQLKDQLKDHLNRIPQARQQAQ
jgi:aminopeptidase N